MKRYIILDANGYYVTELMYEYIDDMLFNALPTIGAFLYESLERVYMLNTFQMEYKSINSILLHGCDGWNMILMYNNKFEVLGKQEIR